MLLYLVLTSCTFPLLYYCGVEANRKLVEDWIKMIYRKLTGAKTAEQIEQEAKERRKEQVKNVVISDQDFAQFIYVGRATKKWKSKVMKKKELHEEMGNALNQTKSQDISSNLDYLERRKTEDGKESGQCTGNTNGETFV